MTGMKYKVISLVAVFGMFLLLILINQDWDTGRVRVHQHLSWPKQSEKSTVTTDPKKLVTHLPIVEIDIGGQKIPGNWIKDEAGMTVGVEKSSTGEETILASIRIVDSGTSENKVGAEAAVETLARFRIRGNSSRNFSKKSYLLKLIDEEENENPREIMGMSEHDQWALYGPFLDKTLMRNYMWMNISAEIMGYAPNVRYCEVILDGEYQGLYLMMETIAKGEGRVNLSTYEEGKSYTDYIVRMDGANGDIRDLNTFSTYTLRTEMTALLSVVYPGTLKLNEKVCDYIEKDFSRFEKALYSSDYTDPLLGYRRYIDVDSFVDYYILQEFSCNNDMCSRSTYLYKDRLNKIHMGPVWDYNNILNNYIAIELDGSEFLYVERLWFDRLLADPYFNQKVIERYSKLRRNILSEDYLMGYMDEVVNYLGDSLERNYEVWGYSFDQSMLKDSEKLRPIERNPKSFEEAVTDMKEFLKVRGRWLDTHIDALSQYCHESRAKAYDNR